MWVREDVYVSIVAIFELEYEGDDGVSGDGGDEVVLEGVEELGLLLEEMIEEGLCERSDRGLHGGSGILWSRWFV